MEMRIVIPISKSLKQMSFAGRKHIDSLLHWSLQFALYNLTYYNTLVHIQVKTISNKITLSMIPAKRFL